MADENAIKTGAEGQETETETEKTYTEAEVQALLQKESDRRVSEALKKQERKNAEKVKEAEKLAKMNEAEKFQYELEQREKAIEEKEKALALAENKNEASKILAEKGLSLDLVQFVVAETADDMNANISLLDKAFKASVKAEVEKRLGGKSPKGTGDNGTITKEQFKAMSIREQQELYNSDRTLYNTLMGK